MKRQYFNTDGMVKPDLHSPEKKKKTIVTRIDESAFTFVP
jgi:hypothetical protein